MVKPFSKAIPHHGAAPRAQGVDPDPASRDGVNSHMNLRSLRSVSSVLIHKIFAAAAVSLLPLFFYARYGCASETQETKLFDLHVCRDEKTGLKLFCDPDWQLHEEEDAMLIVIADDPAVTLTIAKIQTPIIRLDELTDPILQEMGQYGLGFTVKKSSVAGTEALEVAGYSAKYPEIRLLDYYFIRPRGKSGALPGGSVSGTQLYSLLFSVNPREKWEEYRDLFKKITRSVEFF